MIPFFPSPLEPSPTLAEAPPDDADDDDDVKVDDGDDDKDPSGKGLLSPEDALRQGELAEGVRKIKVSMFDIYSTCADHRS